MKNRRTTLYAKRYTLYAMLIALACLILPQAALAASPIARDISAKVIKDTRNSTLNTLKLQASDADTGDTLSYTLLSLPLHGQLKEETSTETIITVPYLLSSNKLKYIPAANYTGADSFTYKANDGTSDSDTATVSLNIVEWFAPIGIPEPSFGIKETYRMYDDPAKRNLALTYTQNAEGGYYTHYIDNTSPQATDTANPYGTAVNPRLTIPMGAPEGSVVEIHGGPYTNEVTGTQMANKRLPLKGFGTVEKPVFIRGINFNNKPVIIGYTSRGINAEGAYIIIENIDFGNGMEIWPRGYDGDITHHIAIRNSVFHKENIRGNGISVGWPYGGLAHYQDPTLITDVVIYNNTIHDVGQTDWNYWIGRGDPKDSLGVYVHHNAYHTWVLDNHIYNIDGGGVHLNTWGIDDNTQFPPTLTYIGRNEIHHNRELCITAKVAYDTITSQNRLYNIHGSIGAMATALVAETDHETPKYPIQERAWHLFNEIYDADRGIRVLYTNDVYLIGNVIHDIVSVDPLQNDPWSSGYGIGGYDTNDVNIYNNVIYNCDFGILNAGNRDYSEVHIGNNIVYNLTGNFFAQFGEQPYQVWIGSGSGAQNRSTMNNNLLYQGGSFLHIGWGSNYYDILSFQVGTGQGQGSLETDPVLTNPTNGDFSLQAGSLAIDAGISSGAVGEAFDRFEQLYGVNIRRDAAGNPRPQGPVWDIGAYEYVSDSRTILYGDVSGDNEITAYDAALTAQVAVGLITLTAEQIQKADVSGDAEVSAYDAALIAQRAVGLIDRFPVEG